MKRDVLDFVVICVVSCVFFLLIVANTTYCYIRASITSINHHGLCG